MDEILIEEKKYISSKRAAKVTGYAKDYIGQLCREGRVSARLVGRNWYVLESAIRDHRFGDSETDTDKDIKTVSPVSELPSTRETFHYESPSEEILPSINRLRTKPPESVASSQEKESEISPGIQDSWRTWFDHLDHIKEDVANPELETESEPQKEIEMKEDTPVDIPIHAVSRTAPPELLPHNLEVWPHGLGMRKEPAHHIKREENRAITRTIQICGALLAIIVASVAVIGSGYFDEYILSNSQARMIAGVSFYNK